MEELENKKKISIIIPAYNNEAYLSTCINSVLDQTYDNYEIIIINDGSEDDTLYLANQFAQKYSCITVIDNENRGQGYSRNYALNFAKGDYILFLDSDDFLEPMALEVAINRIIEDESDLVVFDWKYYKTNNKTYSYVNKNKIFSKKNLFDDECLELLAIANYFTVNKLYSKKFLQENNIRYGEGYIYEDNEFWVNVCINAKKVSLIHSPLYNVRISTTSSTKTNCDTDWHYYSYIKAVKEMMSLLRVKGEQKEQYYYLYKYLIKKFWVYYEKRVPKKYKKKFISEFVDSMSYARIINYNVPNKLTKWTFKLKIFEKKRKVAFRILYLLYKMKKKYNEKIKKLKGKIKKIQGRIKSLGKKKKEDKNIIYWKASKGIRKKDIILFMGFDYRYTGNSRYLFEQIIERRTENVFFVTEDEQVSKEYRIKPESDEFYSLFYSARIVIFESWIPEKLRKTPCAVWIQLWHGTPLKKMLFDSEEKEIITTRPNHKILKYNNIRRWNYLLTDNSNINKYFERAFLMPPKRILPLGYPRVEYLINNKENVGLKEEIKEKANLPLDKKIVAYLPTWRDYNYGVADEDLKLDYFLKSEELKKHLGDGYILVSKNHNYLDKNSEMTNIELETQELLLVADYLITDYSSVMFDAFAIDLPVILLAKDYEEYMQSRGVYQEIWTLMENITCTTEEEAAWVIKNYKIDSNYNNIKENLCYKNDKKDKLYELILKMAERKGKLIKNVLIFEDSNTINYLTLKKIEIANNIGNKIVFGITNCKKDEFEKQKELLEQLKGISLVVPIKTAKPTNEDIVKYQIDTVVTTSSDSTTYDCDVEYI